MNEVNALKPTVITPAQAQERWEQALALFNTWTTVWADNPTFAKQAGKRVEELMLPLAEVQLRHAKNWL